MTKQPRPKSCPSSTYQVKTGCGMMYVTLTDNPLTGELFEVFPTLGKAGGCGAANKEAVGLLASIALRSGTSILDIVKALDGVACPRSNPHPDPIINIPSCITAIALKIKEHENLKAKK